MPPKEVIVYSGPLCGDCIAMKDFLQRHNIAYEERDIKADPEHARYLQEQTGKLGVPYLILDGEWVRGYVPGQRFDEDWAKGILGLA